MIRNLLTLILILIVAANINAQVVEEWYRTYDRNSGGNQFAGASKIMTDDNGNIIVGGISFTEATGRDITIIKYTQSGDTLWITNYTGQGNFTDQLRDMVIDDNGNIYAAGESYSGSGSETSDMLVLKFDTNGFLQWEKKYNGQAGLFDYATGIALDNAGNIYITGNSNLSSSEYEIVTIKYNNTGDSVWVKNYNPNGFQKGPRNIVTDNTGNVYITLADGGSPGSLDTLVVVKYDTAGNEQWVTKKASPRSVPMKIAIDHNGYIYVAGVDYLTNPGRAEILTLKINSLTGDVIWEKTYQHPGGEFGSPTDIKIDAAGNIYVCGKSKGIGTGHDYITLKYNSSGALIFTARYSGADPTAGVTSEQASAITLDDLGNVYVTGFIMDSISAYDIATIKYNQFGDSVWVKKWSSPFIEGSQDFGNAIVFINGNIYAAGSTKNSNATGAQMLTIKYVQVPEAPGNLSGSFTGAGNSELTWTDNSKNEEYFEVWRKDNVDTAWIMIDTASANATEWNDTGLEEGRTYTYRVRGVNIAGFSEWSNELSIIITDVENTLLLPEEFILYQNYPNPFNPNTTIKYAVPFASIVKIVIHNILGETISEIVNDVKEIGYYEVHWNAGSTASGIYFYSMDAMNLDGKGRFNSVSKMILIK